MHLPKAIENDPEVSHLAGELVERGRPLWSDGTERVAPIEFTPAIEAALRSAHSAGRLVRGFEEARRTLATEARGMRLVDEKTGASRGGRVSRLLVITDDGSERFYRSVDSLLREHAPRILGLRLTADEHALGAMFFGGGQVARLVLVEHKDAVSALLRGLAADWKPA